MPFSISFAIKMGIMIVLFTTVYFTVTQQTDLAQKTKYQNEMKEIAEYVESKALYGMKAANAYGSNTSQALMLPYLDADYAVSLSCGEYFEVKVSSAGAGRYYLSRNFINCSKVQASGEVYAGKNCVETRKQGNVISIILSDSCGIV